MEMCRKVGTYFYKQKLIIVVFVAGIICNPVVLMAQSDSNQPCGLDDPYAACPLDTWIWVFCLFAIAFAGYHLYRKNKRSAVLSIRWK